MQSTKLQLKLFSEVSLLRLAFGLWWAYTRSPYVRWEFPDFRRLYGTLPRAFKIALKARFGGPKPLHRHYAVFDCGQLVGAAYIWQHNLVNEEYQEIVPAGPHIYYWIGRRSIRRRRDVRLLPELLRVLRDEIVNLQKGGRFTGKPWTVVRFDHKASRGPLEDPECGFKMQPLEVYANLSKDLVIAMVASDWKSQAA